MGNLRGFIMKDVGAGLIPYVDIGGYAFRYIESTDGLPVTIRGLDGVETIFNVDGYAPSFDTYPTTLTGNVVIKQPKRIKKIHIIDYASITTKQLKNFTSLENFWLSAHSTHNFGRLDDVRANVKILSLFCFVGGTFDFLHNGIEHIQIVHQTDTPNPNFCSGNIGNLPNSLTTFVISGGGTTTGNIANLPQGLTNFSNGNINGAIDGDVATLPSTIEFFRDIINNTLYGDISLIPSSILKSFRIDGENYCTGDVEFFQNSLIDLFVGGNNTIYGNIDATLLDNLVSLEIYGYNTISGGVNNFPVGLATLILHGYNTVYGSINYFPETLRTIEIAGYNTCSGDLKLLPINLNKFMLTGKSKDITYSGGRKWGTETIGSGGTPMQYFICIPESNGLTSSQVNGLLGNLAGSEWSNEKIINLTGANAPRTSASNANVVILQNKGVTVITN